MGGWEWRGRRVGRKVKRETRSKEGCVMNRGVGGGSRKWMTGAGRVERKMYGGGELGR